MRDAATDALVERKLVLLVGYADELRPLVEGSGSDASAAPSSGGPAAAAGPNVVRRAIERLVQLLVEVAADCNGLIVAARGGAPPVTARESFVAVRDLGVLPNALAARFIASYVGLRDRVVHDYDTLDHRLVQQAARRLAADALAYARQVRRWLAAPRA